MGLYSDDANFFAAAVTNGPLTAPSDSASGGNGVYAYGSGSTFPSNTYQATNYWVDVVFAAGSGAALCLRSPITTAVFLLRLIPRLQSRRLVSWPTIPILMAGTLSLTGASGATNGTVVWNATTQVVTFTPTTGFSGTATFTYTITNGQGTRERHGQPDGHGHGSSADLDPL